MQKQWQQVLMSSTCEGLPYILSCSPAYLYKPFSLMARLQGAQTFKIAAGGAYGGRGRQAQMLHLHDQAERCPGAAMHAHGLLCDVHGQTHAEICHMSIVQSTSQRHNPNPESTRLIC